jgi:adenine deaminase
MTTRMRRGSSLPLWLLLAALSALSAACGGPRYDVVIRHGDVIDGTGAAARRADVAIAADKIVAIGEVMGRGRT